MCAHQALFRMPHWKASMQGKVPQLLWQSLHADLLLMDDEEGVIAARGQGLAVTGTLGVLSRAAQRHLLDLADAFDSVKKTNFRFRQEIMDKFLNEISAQESD